MYQYVNRHTTTEQQMNIKTPEFCYIAPIEYLHYTEASNSHLVLAHLADTNQQYANFYKKLSKSGTQRIIMDNSAYELKEPYDTDKLISLGHKCGADTIVLPDYPFQTSDVTIKAAEKYVGDFRKDGFHTFFVPQSETGDVDDWYKGYAWAVEHADIDVIGMSILGIPNALPHIHPSYARVVMTQNLINDGLFDFDKHHHYLGLNAGPGLEIPSLLRMGALDSIDSSGPVWSAILGHQYTTDADSLQTVSKLKMPVNFHHPYTKDDATIARIDHNIKLTNDLFDTSNDVSTWYAQE